MCDQQSLRSPCAYAQPDQSLCWSLNYAISVKLLTEHHFEFLSLKGGCIDLSDSTLVKIPHYWKSHVAAHKKVCYNKGVMRQSALLVVNPITLYKSFALNPGVPSSTGSTSRSGEASPRLWVVLKPEPLPVESSGDPNITHRHTYTHAPPPPTHTHHKPYRPRTGYCQGTATKRVLCHGL